MALRLRVKITPTKGGNPIETIAVANTAYESDKREIALPLRMARQLRLSIPKNSKREEYIVATGKFKAPRVPEAVQVEILTSDRKRDLVVSDVVVLKKIDEILLNDLLLSSLKVEILDPAKGLWRLKDDPIGLERKGE